MQKLTKSFSAGALAALGLACCLTWVAQAQTPPAPPPPPTTEVPAVSPADGKSAVAAEATPAAKSELRRLDETTTADAVTAPQPAAPASDEGQSAESADQAAMSAPAATAAVAVTAAVESPAPVKEPKEPKATKRRHSSAEGFPLGNHTVPSDARVDELVSILGNSMLDGESSDAVVSILGNTTINGKAGGEAVAVLGDVTVNGEVNGEVVAVLGNVTLGPKAVIRGQIVSIGGQLHRDVGAEVHGGVQVVNFLGANTNFDWLKTWVRQCAVWGRPLAFHSGLGWAWTLAGLVFSFYVLLALLFPKAFEKCAETLEQRPGYSLLAIILTALITPVLIVVLVLTGVGIILVPFVVMALFVASVFGKAVMHAWLGRRLTKYFGDGPMKHVAMATLIGSLLLLLLYTVPFLGFLLWKVLGVIGTGVVVYTVILGMRRERQAQPAAAAVAGAGAAATAALGAIPPAMGMGAGPGGGTTAVPPVLPVTALPRAGFWIRIAASALDTIIVGIVLGVVHLGSWFLPMFLIYCVVLWALRGTTIGGIVCGLKVVRLDEREVDWTVAIVRGLGGFLSLAVVGLGFVWVAFDNERQAWHDKIAGTTIVRMPKGVSLL